MLAASNCSRRRKQLCHSSHPCRPIRLLLLGCRALPCSGSTNTLLCQLPSICSVLSTPIFHWQSIQSASTWSTRLSTLFKTCMDAAIYPQTRHAPTTYIPGLKNLLNMYVCCSQQSKSVRLINTRIESLRNPGHR